MSKAKVVGVASAAVLALAAGLISKWEGVEYKSYKDVVGVWTACYGHTGPDVVPGATYTLAECKAMLREDMLEANHYVRKCVGRPMPEGVEAALTSLVFNVGPKPVCSGTPGRYAQLGEWRMACASLSLYKFAGGRVYRGLVLRRADERRVCEAGL